MHLSSCSSRCDVKVQGANGCVCSHFPASLYAAGRRLDCIMTLLYSRLRLLVKLSLLIQPCHVL